jgi:hypothetical protein
VASAGTGAGCIWHTTEDEAWGYLAWNERAARSHRRGERQRRCAGCGRFFWSWETRAGISEERATS